MLQKIRAAHEKYFVMHFAVAKLPETDPVYQFFFEVFLPGLFRISFKKI